MIFGKTIFLLRCPYYNCKKILGEVDSEGRIKTKTRANQYANFDCKWIRRIEATMGND
ncbi:hypothetical protein LCGC14_1436560 [marine sediment metagenome]|uniref:Uncharacterized protein n=1 Tax=marine sediment metagenome TaxID=412755 RepID=A0A0F9K869_9ZZZZ